jgi:hypothetical protein
MPTILSELSLPPSTTPQAMAAEGTLTWPVLKEPCYAKVFAAASPLYELSRTASRDTVPAGYHGAAGAQLAEQERQAIRRRLLRPWWRSRRSKTAITVCGCACVG